MKKWLIIMTSFIAVCVLTLCITIYVVARQPLLTSIEAGETRAKGELQLQTIEESYVYNSTQSYNVVQGITNNEEWIVSFYPVSGDEEPQTRAMDEGITKDEVLAMLYEEDNPSKIMSAKLGYESIGPVWEIIYLDEEKTLNYYYVSFDDGEWWRTIRNL